MNFSCSSYYVCNVQLWTLHLYIVYINVLVCKLIAVLCVFPSIEKPMIQEISGSTTINQGSVLDLYCNVKGQPQPVVTWSHNDLVIDVTLNTRVALQEGGMRLVVQFVSSSDSGDYVCMSQNAAGVASHMVQVFVRGTRISSSSPFLFQYSQGIVMIL